MLFMTSRPVPLVRQPPHGREIGKLQVTWVKKILVFTQATERKIIHATTTLHVCFVQLIRNRALQRR